MPLPISSILSDPPCLEAIPIDSSPPLGGRQSISAVTAHNDSHSCSHSHDHDHDHNCDADH